MPALTYAYEYEKDKFAAVYRSSQSKVGVQNSRSSDDELMLRMIGNHKIDPKSNYYVYVQVNHRIQELIVKYMMREVSMQLLEIRYQVKVINLKNFIPTVNCNF